MCVAGMVLGTICMCLFDIAYFVPHREHASHKVKTILRISKVEKNALERPSVYHLFGTQSQKAKTTAIVSLLLSWEAGVWTVKENSCAWTAFEGGRTLDADACHDIVSGG